MFIIICILSLAALGVVAAVASLFSKGSDAPVTAAHNCASCAADCKLREKMLERDNKNEGCCVDKK